MSASLCDEPPRKPDAHSPRPAVCCQMLPYKSTHLPRWRATACQPSLGPHTHLVLLIACSCGSPDPLPVLVSLVLFLGPTHCWSSCHWHDHSFLCSFSTFPPGSHKESMANPSAPSPVLFRKFTPGEWLGEIQWSAFPWKDGALDSAFVSLTRQNLD